MATAARWAVVGCTLAGFGRRGAVAAAALGAGLVLGAASIVPGAFAGPPDAAAARQPPLRFKELRAPQQLGIADRTVRLRVSATRPSTLIVGGRRLRIGRRLRAVRVAVTPGVGSLRLTLRLRDRRSRFRRTVTIRRPATLWDGTLEQVRPGGQVSTQTALAAFALAIAPVPGVDLPPGPVGTVTSGSGALRWVRARVNGMTPRQRAAVTAALRRLRRPPNARVPAAPSHSPEEYELVLGAVRRVIERHLGGLGGVGVTAGPVARPHRNPEHGNAVAFTEVVHDPNSGKLAACLISFPPAGDALQGRDFVATMAHEVFHCYQAALMGTAQAYNSAPPWLAEGSAEWVAAQVTAELLGSGKIKSTRKFLQAYMRTPDVSLFARAYSAVGFFSQLAWQGVDPWARLPATLAAAAGSDASAQAFAAAVPVDQRHFLGAWGASFFRTPRWGRDWTLQADNLPPDKPTASVARVNVGTYATDVVAPLSSRPIALRGGAAVVTATGLAGVARIRDRGGHDDTLDATTGAATIAMCLRNAGCRCPSDSGRESPVGRRRPVAIALTGELANGDIGGELRLHGQSVSEYCRADCASASARCPPSAIDTCSLYSVAEATAVITRLVAGRHPVEDVRMFPSYGSTSGLPDVCTWRDRLRDSVAVLQILDVDDFRRELLPQLEPVSGVGDAAYIGNNHQVWFFVGPLLLSVHITAGEPIAEIAETIALAQLIAARARGVCC